MIMLAIMIACPLIFRYVLHWNGSVQHYAYMILMTSLTALLMYATIPMEQNRVLYNIEQKCENNPAACLVWARSLIAKHDYIAAVQATDKGMGQSTDHALRQMNIHAKILANLTYYHKEIQVWLFDFPDDHMIRQAYANELISHGGLNEGLTQCRYLFEQCSDPHRKTHLKNQIQDLKQLLSMGGTQ